MACEASVFVSEQSLGARQELLILRPEIGARAKIDGSGDGEAGACPIAPPPASLIFLLSQFSRDQTLLCYGTLTTAGRGFFHFLALTNSFASLVFRVVGGSKQPDYAKYKRRKRLRTC